MALRDIKLFVQSSGTTYDKICIFSRGKNLRKIILRIKVMKVIKNKHKLIFIRDIDQTDEKIFLFIIIFLFQL